MDFDLFPKKQPFDLLLSIRVFTPVALFVTLFDPQTKRVYAHRRLKLQRGVKMRMKLPIVPDELTASIYTDDGADDKFRVERIEVEPDKQCPIHLTDNDRNFIAFAKYFAVELPRLEAGPKGTIYQSEGFSILYIDHLKDGDTELTTPARIDRGSGMIEVSKAAVQDYTVPMLMIMLLHEYSHKWKNPEFGKDVANELTADIIAVHIALNLGFDYTEVENCFRSVFSHRDTELNRRRMKAICEFIEIFKKSEQERCNNKSHESRPK